MDVPHPLSRLIPSPGRSGKAGPTAALSSRPPGGSKLAGRWGRCDSADIKARRPGLIRWREWRASREGGRFGRIPLSSRGLAGAPSRRPCTSLQGMSLQGLALREGRGCGGREAALLGPAGTEPPSWSGCVTSGLSLPSLCFGFHSYPPPCPGSPSTGKILGRFPNVWITEIRAGS